MTVGILEKWRKDITTFRRVGLAGFFHFEDFASLVVSALRAGPMWHLLLVAVRTLGKRVWSKKIMGAAPRSACLRVPPFRIRHDEIPLVCVDQPGRTQTIKFNSSIYF